MLTESEREELISIVAELSEYEFAEFLRMEMGKPIYQDTPIADLLHEVAKRRVKILKNKYEMA